MCVLQLVDATVTLREVKLDWGPKNACSTVEQPVDLVASLLMTAHADAAPKLQWKAMRLSRGGIRKTGKSLRKD